MAKMAHTDERAEAAYRSLAARPTEDLLRIWRENDREEWSEHAFAAVDRLLAERQVPLPEQEAPPAPEPPAARDDPNGEPVTIARYLVPVEAEMARLRLDAHGIRAFVFDETAWSLGGMVRFADMAHVRLRVRRDQVEDAIRILGLNEPPPATELEASSAPAGWGTEPEASSAPAGFGTELEAASAGSGTELEASSAPAGFGTELEAADPREPAPRERRRRAWWRPW